MIADSFKPLILSTKQFLHIVVGERLEEAGFGGDDVFYQCAFLLLQLQDLFLHGITGDDLIDEDRFVLPDAMSAVGGLHLDGRIPPGIEMDDIIGGGQVQTHAARFEADEEEGIRRIVLELVNARLSVGGLDRKSVV